MTAQRSDNKHKQKPVLKYRWFYYGGTTGYQVVECLFLAESAAQSRRLTWDYEVVLRYSLADIYYTDH